MAGRFIFRKDIEKAIKDGKKEILIPQDARISSEALDLIKEKNISVKYSQEQSPQTEDERELGSAPETVKVEETGISESEVEEIVNRVIQRIRELRHKQGSEKVVRAEEAQEDDDMIICRCEEITKGEIREAIRSGIKTLNGIKRVTRAGMGLCQGQTCERLVSQILCEELGVKREEVEPSTARAPVRPVPISVFATG
ncbi:MAG: (2Fe-2S)-binding protein [Deltaproteobacteria bacterium]|nr:(2Fe-2S)-binding protein [Deltaproteobacteria bacterium]MBW2024551.1 (2Fe-2S)-binding protein [Deltaproteobacteria bacterium]MBW2124748.1 (2Fe-2S)-binding protein [Deltaproteobacteria bacterium]